MLARLVDRSLVVPVHDDALPRYRLLEMIRTFAVQRLRRSGRLEAAHARHLEWCQSLADAEREAWTTGAASRVDSEWRRLHAERDNLRVALRWCVDAGKAQPGLRLAATLWPYWFTRGLFAEGSMWLEALVRLPGAEARTIYRARALGALSHALSRQGFASDFDRMVALGNEAVEIAFETGDPGTCIQTLDGLGVILRRVGRHAESLEALKTGLGLIDTWAEPERVWWEQMLLRNLARVSLHLHRGSDARAWASRSLAIAREAGMRYDLARALLQWGIIAFLDGDTSAARDALGEGLATSHATNDPSTTALILRELGLTELACGISSAARDAFEQALTVLRPLNEPEVVCDVLAGVVAVSARDQPAASLQLASAIEQLKGELVGAGLADVLQINFQRAVDLARRKIGAEVATEQLESGARFRLTEAIEFGAQLLERASLIEGSESSGKTRPPAGLTEREWEVARLLAEGLTNRQIAEQLVVGERTIDTHVERLRAKLGVRSRVQIATWVREQQATLA